MRLLFIVCTTLLFVGFSGCIYAQDEACPEGNLLTNKKAEKLGALQTQRLTDNVISSEGDPWNTPNGSILIDDKSHIVFDLGARTKVAAIYIQADNNDTYQIEISDDGTTFESLWVVPMHPNQGMRTRTKQNLNARGRYIKVGSASGDKAYSISEMQIFCAEQALWPPAFKENKTEKIASGKNSREKRLAQGKMLTALFGLIIFLGLMLPSLSPSGRVAMLVSGSTALVSYVSFRVIAEKAVPFFTAWGVWGVGLTFLGWLAWLFVREGNKVKLASRGALVWLILCSATVWINYGTFHGNNRMVHYWDSFHYYMGSKYFKEVRYDYLYACSNIGEIDDGQRNIMKRHVRDLRNNALLPAEQSLAGMSTICHQRFTPERWAAFRQDLRLFRSYMGSSWWAKMFKDHGYNATPVWNMTGHLISNWGWQKQVPPPDLTNSPTNIKSKTWLQRKAINTRFQNDRKIFEARIKGMSTIDFILYGGIFVLIFWAFGLRTCALASLIWACGYPWAYYWTGGGYGRVPWLFMGIAALCLLKRGYPLLAGFAFTWTAMLRVFPGALISGVSVVISDRLLHWFRGTPQIEVESKLLRGVSFDHRRIILGCFLGLAVLVPNSLLSTNGPNAYKEFLENSLKHNGTPLTNYMGLPTLLSYHPNYIGQEDKELKFERPFSNLEAEA